MWVKLLSVPYRLIYPTVLFLIAIGVYSTNNNVFDVGVVLFVGVFGYLAASLGFQPAPLLMGFILGPMLEENFRRALLLSRGNAFVFFERPLSGSFMAITILMLATVAYKRLRNRPKPIAVQEDPASV
jgi:TctA family transporter